MDTTLSGHTILVVEDEPLIALDIANDLQNAGAKVAVAHSLADARNLVERNGMSAAVVDFGLGDGMRTSFVSGLTRSMCHSCFTADIATRG